MSLVILSLIIVETINAGLVVSLGTGGLLGQGVNLVLTLGESGGLSMRIQIFFHLHDALLPLSNNLVVFCLRLQEQGTGHGWAFFARYQRR